MDQVSMHYPNSPSRDIWRSNSSKIYNTVKTRSASVNDYSTEDGLNILPSPVMTGVGSHRSRLHSFPISEGINSGSRMNLDVVEDTFCSGPTSLKSGLANLASDWHSNGFQVQPMLSTELKPNMQKPTTSGNWLEVSIDSTLPVSPPGISKNVFDLSHLDTDLPEWKPATMMTTHSKHQSPPPKHTGSSLMKRLLPEISSSKMYSRKVFIGGLPPDIDQTEIRISFEQYGPLTVDWPHKVHSKSNVPPKGYAFLLFKEELSVHKLLTNCFSEGEKLFTYVKYLTSGTLTKKKVQIRPWKVSDSFYMANSDFPGDSRKAIFVGGVPRPLKASELAEIMSEKFGPVTFIAIDCDSDLKYPKGAACVIFATHTSYIASVSSRFMQLVFGSIEKKVELKPYILDDQLCDECNGIQSNNQPAPFFCGSVTCLRYYCEHCWATFHSLPGRQNHRPMFKDVFDREKFC